LTERDEQFHDFALARRPGLVHTATMLTAGDRHLAEDVVQKTLTSLYVNWSKFQRADNPDRYLRRALVNSLTDEHRLIWRRRERSTAEVPDTPAPRGSAEDERVEPLRQALKQLPPKMRAAVVFRYFYDLDYAETAEALGCSQSTVRSQTVRALDRLRAIFKSDLSEQTLQHGVL
jgi:RNA polymerase sigma-70 factor (sigma-E family)